MTSDARDLDLNLLRVFSVVAETGSVTAAARRLYLTQPAVSAALKRLQHALGAPLFARRGRGLVLTRRGEALRARAEPHLRGLIDAAIAAPEADDLRHHDRTLRLGLSDAYETLLLPPLIARLAAEAPKLRLVVVPVQFRTVADAFERHAIDLAVTVADELPAGVSRAPLHAASGFVALYDPRHVRLGRAPSRERYLAQRHVIVSYNGDLRGMIEDSFGARRDVRVSLASFHAVGAVVEGSALVATVPKVVADAELVRRPALRTARVPFAVAGSQVEIAWRSDAHDAALRWARDTLQALAAAAVGLPRRMK